MVLPAKFDIALISFRAECEMLDLCLSSIDKKFDPQMINRILVVWNHDDDQTNADINGLYAQFARYSHIQNKLLILPRRDLLGSVILAKEPPWRLQQVLKLETARHSECDHLLVLDTKNHYLRPVTLENFFDQTGRAEITFKKYGEGPFKAFLMGSFEYFKISWREEYRLMALPTTTPHMMYREDIVQMLEKIEHHEQMPFAKAFIEQPGLFKTTEFLLYYAYLVKTYQTIETLYKNTATTNVTFFRTDPNTPQSIDAKLKLLKDPATLSMGVHRERYITMSDSEKNGFMEAWVQNGLMRDEEEAANHIKIIQEKL